MPNQDPPQISLTHGQALIVLWETLSWWRKGSQTPEPWMDSFVKALRLNGCPFDQSELGAGTGFNVVYGFDHLMELGVALLLRGSGIAKLDTARYLAEKRGVLRPIYRQAYAERNSDLGAPTTVSVGGNLEYRDDGQHFITGSQYLEQHSGLFVDLGISYVGSSLAFDANPKALNTSGVIRALTFNRDFTGIIHLSRLAENIVGASRRAPEVRRGRK